MGSGLPRIINLAGRFVSEVVKRCLDSAPLFLVALVFQGEGITVIFRVPCDISVVEAVGPQDQRASLLAISDNLEVTR